MNKSAIDSWAQDLTRKVYSEYSEKYSSYTPGFKIFYSPIKLNPDLLVLSYQPGGSTDSFEREHKYRFERSDFRLPERNEYSTAEYTMAKSIRKFFDFEGGQKLLENSVVFPIIFFRAPSIDTWRQVPKEDRKGMEELCIAETVEIIKKIKPKKILALGFSTYQLLKEALPTVEVEIPLHTRRNGAERMLIKTNCGGFNTLAIIHPSGARISALDREKLKNILYQEFRKN